MLIVGRIELLLKRGHSSQCQTKQGLIEQWTPDYRTPLMCNKPFPIVLKHVRMAIQLRQWREWWLVNVKEEEGAKYIETKPGCKKSVSDKNALRKCISTVHALLHLYICVLICLCISVFICFCIYVCVYFCVFICDIVVRREEAYQHSALLHLYRVIFSLVPPLKV